MQYLCSVGRTTDILIPFHLVMQDKRGGISGRTATLLVLTGQGAGHEDDDDDDGVPRRRGH